MPGSPPSPATPINTKIMKPEPLNDDPALIEPPSPLSERKILARHATFAPRSAEEKAFGSPIPSPNGRAPPSEATSPRDKKGNVVAPRRKFSFPKMGARPARESKGGRRRPVAPPRPPGRIVSAAARPIPKPGRGDAGKAGRASGRSGRAPPPSRGSPVESRRRGRARAARGARTVPRPRHDASTRARRFL